MNVALASQLIPFSVAHPWPIISQHSGKLNFNVSVNVVRFM